jgi:hypothetical protein
VGPRRIRQLRPVWFNAALIVWLLGAAGVIPSAIGWAGFAVVLASAVVYGIAGFRRRLRERATPDDRPGPPPA